MAGYSGTPLVQKLGIKAGMRLHLADAPPDYPRTLGRVPTVVQTKQLKGPLDFIQQFAMSRQALEGKFPALVKALAPAGMLWVSWPKQAAKLDTDLTEDVIRAIALAHGLVDVKVCAIDDVWSGLKLVRRLEDRR
jgi:alkylation response protein AidB-like acyl-CoA dehydrogenase